MSAAKKVAALEQVVAKLTADLSAEKTRADDNFESGKKWRALADEREKIADGFRDKNNDLKKRLSEAERENQRMRGYIQRVQEDDTVREDLVAIGDPQGEQQLVPKRKRTEFPSANQYTDFSPGGDSFEARYLSESDRKRNTKHWVTY